jgi:ornithine cyclodeaminase/alanine dehydrogenase-like protein (mu-crystallin family)
MARETIILTRREIAEQVDIIAGIDAIEEAMGAFEKGNDYLPPKAIFEIPVGDTGTAYAACITGYTESANLLSMKIGQERTNNPARGLPTTDSWIPAFDPETGELLMICDGTLPTMYRTAAAAAVATRHLSRKDAKTLAVIGAGQLGRQCLRAVRSVRHFELILLYDLHETAAHQAAADLGDEMPISVVDAETACGTADVIVTATNSREPIVMASWVRPGTHLSCMGSDLPDKIECETDLMPKCRKFADMIEHALLRGEVSNAVSRGILHQDCFEGSLAQVINGDIAGRENDEQITLYDGVGIGIQDTTIARSIYDQAVAGDLGSRVAFS